MPKEHTFPIPDSDATVTLRSLPYGKARALMDDLQTLLMADDPAQVIGAESFDRVMHAAAASDEDYRIITEELDFFEAWQLWDAYVTFARLEAFFVEAAAPQTERAQRLAGVQQERLREMLAMMKRSGAVPEDFSLSDLRQMMVQQQGGMSPAPSESGSAKPAPKAAKGTSKKR